MNKQYTHCLRCGRKLRTEKTKQLGYGPTCYAKILMKTMKRGLFEIEKDNKK